ncbi:MAG: hypothetical protein WA161_08965, partial [Pseudomonas sp.]|uniref:hypothetical protein n=1 Tax=Pseudomonas sp. TaxID=306 RepID=UPI003BB5A6CB
MLKSAIRPGSNFNRQGGSIFHQRQQPPPTARHLSPTTWSALPAVDWLVHGANEIILGIAMNTPSGKTLLTSPTPGSESLYELNDQSKIMGVIMNRLHG